MLLLRADAMRRGYQESAISYGWAAIRLGPKQLEEKIANGIR